MTRFVGGRLALGFKPGFALVLLGLALWSGREVRGQGAIIIQGVPQQLDPQVAAAMQGAGLPARATAEFDPPVITLGQRTTYRVNVTGQPEGVAVPEDPPAPAGMKLAMAGRGFNNQFTSGFIQPRTTVNFRVAVTNAGSFVMPAFSASANGKPITIPEARLTVLPPGAPGAVSGTGRLFVELPDKEFFIGQAVMVRLIMHDPGDNSLQAVSQPQISGDAFIAENWSLRYRREMRTFEGRPVAASICEVFVFPVKAGPLQFTATAFAHTRRGPMNPSIPQMMDTVMVDADPVAVTVKHVPKEGELPGFTGGIGTFQIEPPKVSTNVARAGDPITLTVTVKGEGNLSRIVPPRIDNVRGWQTFAPSPDNSGAVQIQARGSVIFTYTMIPLSDRIQSTPAIPFSYFSLAKKTHVDLTIPPVAITVLPPPGGTLPMTEPAKTTSRGVDDPDLPSTEREPTLTGLLETPGRRVSSLAPLQQRGWFLALQIVPAGLLAGLWMLDRRRRYLAQHPEVVLRARARRGMKRQLRLARTAASARDAAGFVTAAVNALREACAPQAAGHAEALVCADVLAAMAPEERENGAGQLVRTLFHAADAQRFENQAPDAGAVLALQPGLEALLAQWRTRL